MHPHPQPIFLGWGTPALPLAAAELTQRYAEDGLVWLDRAVLALPGARAGRRLRELLVEEAERRGARLLPPRIVTTGGLPELLYDPERPLATGTVCRRAWAEALAALPAELLCDVFPARPAEGDLQGWQLLAREVERLHREVGSAGLDFRGVAARCGDGLLFDDSARWYALAEAQDRFRTLLGRHGLADREGERVAALRRGGVRSDRDVWLVGVAEVPDLIRQLLRPLGTRLRVLVHAPSELADRFDEIGCVRAELWRNAQIDIPDEALVVRTSPADQADELVGFIAELGGRYAAEEITVAAPAEEIVPILENRLGEAGVPVRYAAGLPIERSGAYRLLGAVADYLDGRSFPSLAALVRHPDLGDWIRRRARAEPSASVLGSADAWLEPLDRLHAERLPALLPPGTRWGGDRQAELAELQVALEDGILNGLDGRKRLSAWVPPVLGVLIEAYADSQLSPDGTAGRRLTAVAESVREAAASVSSLPTGLDPICDAPTAIRLLLDELAGAVVAPDPEDAAVEMVGWLELHLDDAPAAVLTGLNEPALPQSVNAETFLPNALRTALGLEDNDRRYARDAYQLSAILQSRAALRLVCGRRSATGDPLRPSRLMFALRGAALAERVRRFFGDAEDATPASPGAPVNAPPKRFAGSPAPVPTVRVSRFLLPPEREIRAATPLQRLRVTDFRRILENPYVFALERVLGLEAVDDSARELDGGAFGTLAHEVLSRFARAPEAASADAREVARRLDILLDQRVEERYGEWVVPGARFQFEQLRLRLRAFAGWQAGRAARGWRIVRAECRPSEGAAFLVDDEPTLLTGRIDRVDHHAGEGVWEVLDYKTGERAEDPERSHRRGRPPRRQWVDLQLPLYRHLLSAIAEADAGLLLPDTAGRVRLGYILVPPDPAAVASACADWSAAELEGADETARNAIRTIRKNLFRFLDTGPAAYLDSRFGTLLGRGILAAADGGDTPE
jgi:ATP-dependent helicase/nuclease subunit B